MGIQNGGWEAISAAQQGNLQRAISGKQTNAGTKAPTSGQADEIQRIFEKFFAEQGGSVSPEQLRRILQLLSRSPWSEQDFDAVTSAEGWTNGHKVTCEEFLAWVFRKKQDGKSKLASFISRQSKERGWGKIIDDIYEGRSTLEDAMVHASFEAQLQELLQLHPYLEPGGSLEPHPVQHWVERCRESHQKGKFQEAQDHLRRAIAGIDMDKRQIAEAFRRFDMDASGHLDKAECRHMCAYLGWGHEEADLLDLDKDGRITLGDFQTFVGRMGGVQRLFEHRRLRISDCRKDVCDQSGLVVGARVRSHFYCQRQKSRSWREAVVLGVRAEKKGEGSDGMMGPIGPVTYGVMLQFGFGLNDKTNRWKCRQVVPPHWVLSSVEDASTASALREIGLLDEAQSFWSMLLPDSELAAIEKLEDCQRQALKGTRDDSTKSHERDLPVCRQRFERMGYTGRELEAVFSWLQDLAPIVVHVHLDRMGHFMEYDEYYRNQFETKTSCGALDSANSTRTYWERDLFGGSYDGSKPFERPKYGALNVMNDYRGVVRARQYGDSYLVLKDVRLRTTFCSTDSGGVQGKRLGVLDKYAHVLKEYSDREVKGLVDVAMACTTPTEEPAANLQLLRGSTEDPTIEWVTKGFPGISQTSGKYFFEVKLFVNCGAVQVGLCTSEFELFPRVPSTQGVGDDDQSWGVDGQSSSRWHGGRSRAWGNVWKSAQTTTPSPICSRSLKGLSEEVVVGIAVDIDARRMWVASNGVWDERPTFDEMVLPRDGGLYPAVSLCGQASFNFGPDFSHGPPALETSIAAGSPFLQWAGGLSGSIRVDDPRLGNEDILGIYKEIQIHGECSFKRNVQRLVAAQKYRDKSKMDHNFDVRITKTAFIGTYKRVGSQKKMPVYKSSNTDSACIIYADPVAGMWYINDSDDYSSWKYKSPIVKDSEGNPVQEPPRTGWDTVDEDNGVLPIAPFKLGLKKMQSSPKCYQGHPIKPNSLPGHYCDLCGKSGTAYRCSQGCDYDMCPACYNQFMQSCTPCEGAGMSDDNVEQLVTAMTGKASCGTDMIFKRINGVSLDAVWEKLTNPPGDPAAAWSAGLKEAQQMLKAEADLGKAEVIESEHPYATTRQKWNKEVLVDGTNGLVVHFCSKSCTLDSRTKFTTYTGGLRRNAGGIGSRVEIEVSGRDKIWGTVTARNPEDRWEVLLDREYHAQVDDLVDRSSWPQVGTELEAKYQTGKWHKAKVLEIRDGDIYYLEWFDGLQQDREKGIKELRPLGMQGDHRNLEDLQKYAKVPESDSAVCTALCFDTPASVKVAYQAGSGADEQGFGNVVGDEIAKFGLNRASPLMPFTVEAYASVGPAQEQGVKVGWYFDLEKTLAGPSRTKIMEILKGIGTVEVVPVAVFDGSWSRATISGKSLTWKYSCEVTTIEFIADDKFTMDWRGTKYTATLEADGMLYWNDGDVWYREGKESNDCRELVVAAFQNVEEVVRRLNDDLRRLSAVSLFFTNSASHVPLNLLPEARIRYAEGQKVSQEIQDFVASGREVRAKAFLEKGPTQAAGVRTDWHLDIDATLRFNPTLAKELPDLLPPEPTEEELATMAAAKAAEEAAEAEKKKERPCPDCKTTLVWSNYAEGPYSCGWICNGCRKGKEALGAWRWFCKSCCNDFCEQCVKKVRAPVFCPEGHKVEKADKAKDSWSCVSCSTPQDGTAGRWRCTGCGPGGIRGLPCLDHDLCKGCFEFEMGDTVVEEEVVKPEDLPYEIHDLRIEFSDRDRLEDLMTTRLDELARGLGAGSAEELPMLYPDFLPEITVVTAAGAPVDGPWAFEMLTADDHPVIFKIKLPKASKPEGAVEKKETKPEEQELTEMEAAAKALADKAAAEKAAAKKNAAEKLDKGLAALLQKDNITLVFVQPNPTKAKLYQDSGPIAPDNWQSHEVPGDYADFEFSADGDGIGGTPTSRWGVLAVVLPAEARKNREEVDAFAVKSAELTRRALGLATTPPEVERSGWDEGRLRALCARHGWEFEWMTEDGERRRRAKEKWDAVKIAEVAFRPAPSDIAMPDGAQTGQVKELEQPPVDVPAPELPQLVRLNDPH